MTPHMFRVSVRLRALLPQLALAAFLLVAHASAGSERARRVVDIARTPISRLSPGMTSVDLSIYGVRLGMSWDEARSVLIADNVPFAFAQTVPVTVYLGPDLSSFYAVLNPSSLEVIELGVCGATDLPRENRYLANGQYWRLTTARTFFFGSEGRFVVNEDDMQFTYPALGFALRCVECEGFTFIMLKPEGYRPPFTPVTRSFEIGVPFFVTGYWKPNTTENLADLRAGLRTGSLKPARFINAGDANYDSLAAQVDANLDEAVIFIENTLLEMRPALSRVSRVSIAVRGFADRKEPVPGQYVGTEVRLQKQRIPNGARIAGAKGNIVLAQLRAAHTARELEDRLATSGIYTTFKNAGKIHFTAEGRGVTNGDEDLLAHRRAEIIIHAAQR
ncbi:MAG: hypothetical protein IPP94_11770 [Ignavibacteria bacterium]|nr:hypothetical protein [Ignavibacteria bacterium]